MHTSRVGSSHLITIIAALRGRGEKSIACAPTGHAVCIIHPSTLPLQIVAGTMLWHGAFASRGTHQDGQEFAVSKVCRDVVGLGPQGLFVPVTGFLQPVQPHVGLS